MSLIFVNQIKYRSWRVRIIKCFTLLLQFGELVGIYYKFSFLLTAIPRGLIGPTRQFGTHSIYHPHLYCILIGAIMPIPFYLWQRRYPKSWVRYVSTPVIIAGLSAIPPATGINYSSWFLVAFIFQYLIRKKNFAWWSKFNYVLSSALDSGTVISVMVIFFTLQVGVLVLSIFFGSVLNDVCLFCLVPERWCPIELVGQCGR